jgi:hypothetical protein
MPEELARTYLLSFNAMKQRGDATCPNCHLALYDVGLGRQTCNEELRNGFHGCGEDFIAEPPEPPRVPSRQIFPKGVSY